MRHWHTIPVDEAASALGVDPNAGLDGGEVEKRQQHFGKNMLTPRKGMGPFMRFLLQFHQPLIYILIAAGVVTALLGEWVDSAVIFGVVFVNATIGFVQESKALSAIQALARTMSSEAVVLRGGEKQKIPAAELVPGDVVLLQSGDKVPADVRLLRVRELQVDESALTGESVPVQKSVNAMAQDLSLGDRTNLGYSSTLVTYGTATAVVVKTGDRTEIGRIQELIESAEELATPLTKKITHFSGILLYLILGLAAVTFAVGLLRGATWFEMFMASVALAVGAIPEGLPAAMTITLAIGVGRMAKRNAIIRKLPAVETLGSTTVICSDKTGTLTQNQMTVLETYAGGRAYAISGVGYATEGEVTQDGAPADMAGNRALEAAFRCGILCNDSRLRSSESGMRVEGDPTEGALITSAVKAGFSHDAVEKELPRVDAIPFESEHQYMATMHNLGEGKPRRVYVKGSIESIMSRCDRMMDASGESVEINRDAIRVWAEETASKGLRVLAFAQAEMPAKASEMGHKDVERGGVFLGLQAMIDPPRAEAIAAVAACKKAGILVKMITGDHVATASAIAAKLGLDQQKGVDPATMAMTGRDLEKIAEGDLVREVEGKVVFARVAPEQKLNLVSAHQAKGHVVAMTGDGVNDAPALRQANIGVAMGITGTEVSKEAADMVLTDDNFASIEAAVEEGRGVFDNLTKFITWTIPTNIGEGLVILAAVFLGVTLPILPVQILWINMTTAVLLGLMLAFEPKEAGIMNRAPREPDSPILTRPLVFRMLIVSGLLVVGAFGLFKLELLDGGSDERARTLAVNVFVFGELFYLFNCRSLTRSMFSIGLFSNKWVLYGVGAMTVLQLLYTYTPVMNRMFQSAPIGWEEWGWVLAVSLTIFLVIEFEKWVRRRTGHLAH